MQYAVEVVGDDELPEGVNTVIVEREGQAPVMLLNGAVGRAWQLMRAYEDTLEPESVPSVSMPLRLAASLGAPAGVRVGTGWQALARGTA